MLLRALAPRRLAVDLVERAVSGSRSVRPQFFLAHWFTLAVLALLVTPARTAAQTDAPDLPSSPRSRAAIARVTPALARDLAAQDLTLGSPIFLRIFKRTRELEVWIERDDTFLLFRTYEICSFSGDFGPKLEVGDLQAPEGFYYVTPERLNPYSQYHLSFDLGYPNAYDRHHGRTGSALMVHGGCASIGCFAVKDAAIEEIYTLADAAFRGGQPFFRVHIFPFRLTPERLREHRLSPWSGFWRNLTEGYEYFERHRRPPDVNLEGGRYVFDPD